VPCKRDTINYGLAEKIPEKSQETVIHQLRNKFNFSGKFGQSNVLHEYIRQYLRIRRQTTELLGKYRINFGFFGQVRLRVMNLIEELAACQTCEFEWSSIFGSIFIVY